MMKEYSPEKLNNEMQITLAISSKCNMRDRINVKNVLERLDSITRFETPVGKKYLKHLKQILDGCSNGQCYICGDAAVDGIVCANCMMKYSGGKYCFYDRSNSATTAEYNDGNDCVEQMSTDRREWIKRQIRMLQQLNTYIDNENTFKRCMVFKPNGKGLFPHEIVVLDMIKKHGLTSLRRTQMLSKVGVCCPLLCLYSLQARGFLTIDCSINQISKMHDDDVVSIARKNRAITNYVSLEDTISRIKMHMSDDDLRDSTPLRTVVLTPSGEEATDQHGNLDEAENPWSTYSEASEARFHGMSIDNSLYVSKEYRRVYENCDDSSLIDDDTETINGGVEVNKYISVLDESRIYEDGRYVVGESLKENRSIAAGEYYFWGKRILVLDTDGRQKHDDGERDFYSNLKKGESITVIYGKFTNVSNIIYHQTINDELSPGHMYRCGTEVPYGVYAFKYSNSVRHEHVPFSDDRDCVIQRFKEYRASRFNQENAKSGKIHFNSDYKYIKIFNGIAKYDCSLEAEAEIQKKKVDGYHNLVHSEYSPSIVVGDRLFFYASVCDPTTDIMLKSYYADYEILASPFDDDATTNCRFSVPKNDKDAVCFVLYLFIRHRIDLPKLYGVRFVDLLRFAEFPFSQCFWDGRLLETARKLNMSTVDDYFHIIDDYGITKRYPFILLKNAQAAHTYTKELHPEFDARYYYHAYNNESLYCEMYRSRLSELAEKGLINPRWKNEFALYILLKSYYDDAYYQYKSKWLGKQSLDVFIPSINVGVEYQGIQHYESIDLFGGEDGLENRKRNDEEKRQKCREYDVCLIEWKYNKKISDEELARVFSSYGISLPEKSDYVIDSVYERKDARGNKLSYRIYQYDRDGFFVNEYESINEACLAVGTKGVGKVIKGQQQLAGGFYWKKVELGYSKERLLIEKASSPIQQNKQTEKKAVIQLDNDGRIIMRYDSIKAASIAMGVNQKSIRLAASGKQKHAAGFCWQFENTEEKEYS